MAPRRSYQGLRYMRALCKNRNMSKKAIRQSKDKKGYEKTYKQRRLLENLQLYFELTNH